MSNRAERTVVDKDGEAHVYKINMHQPEGPDTGRQVEDIPASKVMTSHTTAVTAADKERLAAKPDWDKWYWNGGIPPDQEEGSKGPKRA